MTPSSVAPTTAATAAATTSVTPPGPVSPPRGGALAGFHEGSTVMITGATRMASAAL